MARRGRAWGNALGGYKRQARDSKGRFGSGKVGSSVKRTRAKASSTTKKYKKKYKNRGTAAQRTVRTASKRKYNKANLNKQLQRNHRATIAASYVGNYGGMALGSAIGSSTGGPMGALLGSRIGAAAGTIAAQNYVSKRGMLVTDKDFTKAGKDDQAAMARRIKRARRGHMAIQAVAAGASVHKGFKAAGGYGTTAEFIRSQKAKKGTKFDSAIRPGKFGRNKGVYNITTAGRKVPRSKFKTGTMYDGTKFRYQPPSKANAAVTRYLFGP